MNDNPPVNRPVVARTPRRLSTMTTAVGLVIGGFAIFLWLSSARAEQAEGQNVLPGLATTAITTPTPLPVAPPRAPTTALSTGMLPPATSLPVTAIANPFDTSRSDDRALAALRAPVLIVDLAQADSPRPLPDKAAAAVAPVPDNSKALSDSERFAARVGGEEVEVVEAERMTGLNRLVPQGAIVAAVMETALNSDVPGYARAIVQRDVLSFDGSAVLISAGSRVIGQYKSGVAQGASRIFIVWTRLIRPDGVSIALGSPAVDDLGRGGVGGTVDRHFLRRFGGAILLSVLTGGINAASASLNNGSTVIVGSANEASSLATQASGDLQIPPTITTPQGASVRIFVARDLDFTRVGPIGR